MVLDVEGWAPDAWHVPLAPDVSSTAGQAAERAAEILADQGWRVVVVSPATTVPQAWESLERATVPA